MKKLLLILLLLAGVSICQAQNANRSGVFVELAGGVPIGNVLQSTHYSGTIWDNYDKAYFKGGVDLNLSVGYRLAVSNSWAVGLQAGLESNLSAFSDLLVAPKIMLGGRWTSNDLNNGMSFYIQPQAGFALYTGLDQSICIPVGLDIGFNFTNHFYGGLDLSYYIFADGWSLEKDLYQGYERIGYIKMDLQSHMSAKIKLGYRF